jgi:hypothetical protein
MIVVEATAMSQTLTVQIDDQVYAAIREQADAAGTSPEQIAAGALEKAFNKPAATPSAWPEGFFENIRIDDPTFKGPDRGSMPPAREDEKQSVKELIARMKALRRGNRLGKGLSIRDLIDEGRDY